MFFALSSISAPCSRIMIIIVLTRISFGSEALTIAPIEARRAACLARGAALLGRRGTMERRRLSLGLQLFIARAGLERSLRDGRSLHVGRLIRLNDENGETRAAPAGRLRVSG